MLTESIIFTQEGHIAVLTLNRPEHMNMLNQQMLNRLEHLIGKIKNDSHVRVVVIRATGDTFMAGSDLYEVYQELDFAISEMPHLVRQMNSIILTLREMDKPVVAAVHGLVAGVGMSLMLAADLVIASDATQFSMGYCNVGTSPAAGLSFHLPRLVGNKKSLELLFLSDVFDAVKAEKLGLINWVVPIEEMTYHTRKLVETLVNGPMVAFAQTKQLIHSSSQNKLSTQMELEVESFVKTIHSRDFKSAVKAYVNKRQVEFEGR